MTTGLKLVVRLYIWTDREHFGLVLAGSDHYSIPIQTLLMVKTSVIHNQDRQCADSKTTMTAVSTYSGPLLCSLQTWHINEPPPISPNTIEIADQTSLQCT